MSKKFKSSYLIKNFIVGIMILSNFFVLTMVNAKVDENSIEPYASKPRGTYSDIQRGPDIYTGTTAETKTVVLSTPFHNSVTGPITHIYFNALGYLETGVSVPDNSRKFVVDLYEDDEYPNSDDHVRRYTFGFVGLQITDVNMEDYLFDYGNIDSAGDNTVELFTQQLADYIRGDSVRSNGNLINFQYYIDR